MQKLKTVTSLESILEAWDLYANRKFEAIVSHEEYSHSPSKDLRDLARLGQLEISRRWRRPEDMELTDLRLNVVQPLTIAALGLYEVALRTAIMFFQKTKLKNEQITMWNEEQRTRAANEFAVLYEHELKMRAQYRAMRARGAAALAFALSDSLSLLPKKF
jgi:hypothetical protein